MVDTADTQWVVGVLTPARALAGGLAGWLEPGPAHQKVADLTSAQGAYRKQLIEVSLSFSLPLSLKPLSLGED